MWHNKISHAGFGYHQNCAIACIFYHAAGNQYMYDLKQVNCSKLKEIFVKCLVGESAIGK